MSKKAPHRHDAPKHSKKGKKPFTARSAKRIKRAFKLGMMILEALMEVVRLIERIRNIGG